LYSIILLVNFSWIVSASGYRFIGLDHLNLGILCGCVIFYFALFYFFGDLGFAFVTTTSNLKRKPLASQEKCYSPLFSKPQEITIKKCSKIIDIKNTYKPMQDLDFVRLTSLQLIFSLTILFNMILFYRILLIDFPMKLIIKLTKSSTRNNLAINKYFLLVLPLTKSSLQFRTSSLKRDVYM
jgi:hypothetical protein